MGEKVPFQELTLQDRFEVAVYRIGVGIAIAATAFGAALLHRPDLASPSLVSSTLGLFVGGNLAAALFIHLYARPIRLFVRSLGFVSGALLLASLLIASRQGGHLWETLLSSGIGTLTLASFGFILAFVGVKEAFCFRLNEGYLAGIVIPLIPLLHAAGAPFSVIRALVTVAAGLLLLFAARKLFQPMHYDIGDKTKYT
ncbi:MAG: hypothetical protein HYR98_06135 [Nitrospirae bacterium]|nr:hypothetical protein [Nitrospirota bacterium]MBI3393313.1 hypothetical protein [Nitrospirota bacterium]